MKDVRSEKAADRSLERADQGSEQSRPTGLLRLLALMQERPLSTRHYSRISTRFCAKSRNHTKHATKPSLPGSRIAHFASPRPEQLRRGALQRNAYSHPRTAFANALSNRELQLLEPRLIRRKQTTAPRSNRELSTNRCRPNSHAVIPTPTFLTETASHSKMAVTHSKQTLEKFLTGARIGCQSRANSDAFLNPRIDTSSHLAQHGAHSK
jgi:hypothetical protein